MEHFFIYILVTHSVNCGRFMFFLDCSVILNDNNCSTWNIVQ